MKFDENLRNLRKEKDYSQEYLAIKLDVTRQTISKWENGSAMPDLKKLVELAEFFEISMDDLLGLENVSSEKTESSNKENIKNANEYTNQLVERISESQYASKYKGLKTAFIIISVILFISFIINIYSFNDIKNRISNMETNIMYWSNEISNLRNTDNNSGSEYYDIEITIAEYYPETPEKVKAQFKYAPSVYPKNAKIYYLIPQKNGGVERLEAEDNNGEFILTTDVDLSLNKPCYFVLDDGEDIVKQELINFSMKGIYGAFENDEMCYNISETAREDTYYFSTVYGGIGGIYWSAGYESNLKNAEIVVLNNGTEVYRYLLDFVNSDDNGDIGEYYSRSIELPDFIVNDLSLDDIVIYVIGEGSGGAIYKKFIPYVIGNRENTDINNENFKPSGNSYSEIIFTVNEKEQVYRVDGKE